MGVWVGEIIPYIRKSAADNFFAHTGQFQEKKMHFTHPTRLRPSAACRPRPVNAFGKGLDGTGRHAVDGTRPTRKDGDGGQP
jgi:hypothetical protein